MAYLAPIRGGLTPAQYYAAANKGLSGKIFNVEDYGAIHNNSTDDTQAIQDCIDAVDTAGGGVIFFPKGIYKIDGNFIATDGTVTYNSQLLVPYKTNNNQDRKTFHFLGEVSPNMAQSSGIAGGVNQTVPTSGVILRGTKAGSAAGQSMLSGGIVGLTSEWDTNNANQIIIENIQFQPDPDVSSRLTLGAINMKGALDVQIKNVCCFPYNLNLINSGIPQNNCIGIVMPALSASNHNVCDHVNVGGFETGYLAGDHTVFRDTVAIACLYAYQFAANYQIAVGERIGSYWCANDIYVSGAGYLKINELQTEWNQDSKWYDAAYVILDPSNYGHGEIHYNITEANVGFNNARFNKSGGANIQCLPIGFAAASSFTVSGARDNPEAALASLITALAAKGIIIDSTTAS